MSAGHKQVTKQADKYINGFKTVYLYAHNDYFSIVIAIKIYVICRCIDAKQMPKCNYCKCVYTILYRVTNNYLL